MAETIDEARIIAWIDGELGEAEAAWMADAVAADPALAAQAERHRMLKTRFAAAFSAIADQPVALPERESAPVISLAAVRAERAGREEKVAPPTRRWFIPAIAASLLVGVMAGHMVDQPGGVADAPGALAVSPQIASALDSQLSSDAGPVRVALTFRDRSGDYCRSFMAKHVSGVACRGESGWQLRYASAPQKPVQGDYRMAGADDASAQVIAAMISGEPLDRAGEAAARGKGWR